MGMRSLPAHLTVCVNQKFIKYLVFNFSLFSIYINAFTLFGSPWKRAFKALGFCCKFEFSMYMDFMNLMLI